MPLGHEKHLGRSNQVTNMLSDLKLVLKPKYGGYERRTNTDFYVAGFKSSIERNISWQINSNTLGLSITMNFR